MYTVVRKAVCVGGGLKLDLEVRDSWALYEALHYNHACIVTYLHKLIFFIANDLIERSELFLVSSIERIKCHTIMDVVRVLQLWPHLITVSVMRSCPSPPMSLSPRITMS